MGVGVHVRASQFRCQRFKQGGQLTAFFHTARAHARRHGIHIVQAFINFDGCDNQDARLCVPQLQPLGLVHQAAQAVSDVAAGGGKTLLGVVGAQHDNQQIQRAVGGHGGQQVG